MHGHDLKPLIMNPDAKWDHPVLLTLTGRKFGADTDRVPTDPKVRDITGIPWWVFLVKGRYKYIRTLVKGEIEEIYESKLSLMPEGLLDPMQPEEVQNLFAYLMKDE